jgi:hypothetical protein
MADLTFRDAQNIGFALLREWLDAYEARDFKRCKQLVKKLKALDALIGMPKPESTRESY